METSPAQHSVRLQYPVCVSNKPTLRWCSSRSKQGRVGAFETRLSTNTGCVWFAVKPTQHCAWKAQIPGDCIAVVQSCSVNPNMWKAQCIYVFYQESGSRWALWEALWRPSHSREEEQLIKLCLVLHLWPIFKGGCRRRKMKLLFVEFLRYQNTYLCHSFQRKRNSTNLKRWTVWSMNIGAAVLN